jgi:hypothetical protein
LAKIYQGLGRRQEAAAEYAKVNKLHQQSADDLLHKVSGKPPSLVNQ